MNQSARTGTSSFIYLHPQARAQTAHCSVEDRPADGVPSVDLIGWVRSDVADHKRRSAARRMHAHRLDHRQALRTAKVLNIGDEHGLWLDEPVDQEDLFLPKPQPLD